LLDQVSKLYNIRIQRPIIKLEFESSDQTCSAAKPESHFTKINDNKFTSYRAEQNISSKYIDMGIKWCISSHWKLSTCVFFIFLILIDLEPCKKRISVKFHFSEFSTLRRIFGFPYWYILKILVLHSYS